MTHINVYHSDSKEYHQTFKFYLEHCDEKAKTHQWLNQLIERLPARHFLIDAGAGYGITTALFMELFDKTIALEPNASLRAELSKNCPDLHVLPDQILEAQPLARNASADLIFCLHVFYHIDPAEWMANLERLVSWLSPNGYLVLALADQEAQCTKIYKDFYHLEADLKAFVRRFEAQKDGQYEVIIETIPLRVKTESLPDAYRLAEFMLNPPPTPTPPNRHTVEEYVRKHFTCPSGGYCFSCDENLILIRRCF
jgi:SAM-dependent methyltransferase